MKCTRCNGIKYIEKFAHIMNGRCFHCLGTGEEPETSNNRHEITAPKISKKNKSESIRLNRQLKDYQNLINNPRINSEIKEKCRNLIVEIENKLNNIKEC